jgi:PAS domain S-box-containing protein
LASKVFETTADGIVISDRDDRVIRVNSAFTKLTGYTQDEMQNHRVFDSPFTPLDREEAEKRMERLRVEGVVTAQIQRRHKDGSELHLWLTATFVLDGDGEIVNYVRVFSDISQIRNAQRRLEQLANFDSLTGLPNRRLFSDRIQQAILRAERSGCGIGLLFLDLDGFKHINDSCGHDVGDQLLSVVARRLTACVRSSDSLCRLGGDEFTVIIAMCGRARNASSSPSPS